MGRSKKEEMKKQQKLRVFRPSDSSTADTTLPPSYTINLLTLTETEVADPPGSKGLPTKKGGYYCRTP